MSFVLSVILTVAVQFLIHVYALTWVGELVFIAIILGLAYFLKKCQNSIVWFIQVDNTPKEYGLNIEED